LLSHGQYGLPMQRVGLLGIEIINRASHATYKDKLYSMVESYFEDTLLKYKTTLQL